MINNILLWASEHSQCAGSEDVRCLCEGSFFSLMNWASYFMIELSLTIRTKKDTIVMMTLMVMVMVETTLISQIPQLSGGIVHYPGTFDSCLEVISKKSPSKFIMNSLAENIQYWFFNILVQVKFENFTGQHCLLTSYLRSNPFFENGPERYHE